MKQRPKILILEDRKFFIGGCEEFQYMRMKVDKEDRQKHTIKKIINKGRAVIVIVNGVLWYRQITRKKYKIIIK